MGRLELPGSIRGLGIRPVIMHRGVGREQRGAKMTGLQFLVRIRSCDLYFEGLPYRNHHQVR